MRSFAIPYKRVRIMSGAPPIIDLDGAVKSRFGLCVGSTFQEGVYMLYTIAVVLIILWLLGIVSSYTIGGFIHVLIVIAIIMILLQIIQGRKIL